MGDNEIYLGDTCFYLPDISLTPVLTFFTIFAGLDKSIPLTISYFSFSRPFIMEWGRGMNFGAKRNFVVKENPQASELQFACGFLLVIRLGFEPKTPTLKVLCSTS